MQNILSPFMGKGPLDNIEVIDKKIEALGCSLVLRNVTEGLVSKIVENPAEFVEMLDLLIEMGQFKIKQPRLPLFSVFYNEIENGVIDEDTGSILNFIGSCSPIRELIEEFKAYDYVGTFGRVELTNFDVDDQRGRLEIIDVTYNQKRLVRVSLTIFNKNLVPQHSIEFVIDREENHVFW